jgi:ribosomal protein S3
MGQKINPVIFRLNKTYETKSKYFEKKSTELALYNYKNIEIRDFIKNFFESQGLTIHDIKLCYFNNNLHIYISYFSSVKATSLITDNIKKQKIKIFTRKVKKRKYVKVKENTKKYFLYKELNYLKTLKNKNEKRIVNIEKHFLRLRRIRFLKFYKNYLLSKKYKNISKLKTNSFLVKFFESLSSFTGNKLKISLTLKHLNNNIKQKISQENLKITKKNVVKLRKYEKNKFFKEGINIIFLSVINNNSAKLLSDFIANQLKKLKRHNFFLRFLKNALILFHTKKFATIEGIKIKVKGRFNRAPRARHKIILIGKGVKALTLHSKIDYAESTSFTANGTFGVKVWISEKNII